MRAHAPAHGQPAYVHTTSSALRESGAQPPRRSLHTRRRQFAAFVVAASSADKECWLLDYGAGNVRSIRNAISHLGYTVRDVRSAALHCILASDAPLDAVLTASVPLCACSTGDLAGGVGSRTTSGVPRSRRVRRRHESDQGARLRAAAEGLRAGA